MCLETGVGTEGPEVLRGSVGLRGLPVAAAGPESLSTSASSPSSGTAWLRPRAALGLFGHGAFRRSGCPQVLRARRRLRNPSAGGSRGRPPGGGGRRGAGTERGPAAPPSAAPPHRCSPQTLPAAGRGWASAKRTAPRARRPAGGQLRVAHPCAQGAVGSALPPRLCHRCKSNGKGSGTGSVRCSKCHSGSNFGRVR